MVWAIVVTKPNQENKTNEALNDLQLNTRFFRLRKEIVRKGVVVNKILPAFPRYLFVDPENSWRSILNIPSVVDFVRTSVDDGLAPAVLSDQIMVGLEKRSNSEFILLDEEREPSLIKRFHFGQQVQIKNKFNPFSPFPARYHSRNQISVNLLGRFVIVTVDEADLEPGDEIVEETRPRQRRGGRRSWRRRKAFRPHEANSAALQ